MDEKPAFPNWLKRLDPTLAVAECVPAYEAFRLRRTVHSKSSLVRQLKGSFATWSSLETLAWTGAVVLSVVAFLIVGCLAVPFIALAGILASTGFRRKRRTEHVMPRRIGRVFAPGGFLQDAAVDLWLAGVGGRDVLLSIYAERREGKGVAGIVMGCFIYVVAATTYYGAARQHHWAGVLLGILCAWMFFEIWMSGLVAHGNEVRARQLEPQLLVWEKGGANATVELVFSRLWRGLARWIVWILLLVPAAIFLGMCVGAIVEANPASLPARPEVLATGPFGFVMVLVAICLRLRRPHSVERLERENEKMLARADVAFDRFMAGTVVQDPDGEAWAKWLHGLRRPSALVPPQEMRPAAAAVPPPLPQPKA